MGTLRKFLRLLFHTAATISTLLLLITLILWPMSYRHGVVADYSMTGKNNCALGIYCGRPYLRYMTFRETIPTGLRIATGEIPVGQGTSWSYLTWNSPSGRPGDTTWLGVRWYAFQGPKSAEFLQVPASYFAMLFAILPTIAILAIRRRNAMPTKQSLKNAKPRISRRRIGMAVSSLAALLLTTLIWPLSYYRWTSATYTSSSNHGYVTVYAFEAQNGRAWLRYERNPDSSASETTLQFRAADPYPTPFLPAWSYWSWNKLGGLGYRTSLGLSWAHSTVPSGFGPGTYTSATLAVPFSCLTVLSSILSLLALLYLRSHLRRRKTAHLTLCPKCQYDLRAHAPNSRCPECGTPISPTPRAPVRP